MANEEHLARLKQGMAAWNRWRKANPNIMPDLSEANLRGANLREALLEEANLFKADLYGAHLDRTRLDGANLRGAWLSRADLFEASLSGADLRGVHLDRAYLGGAWLSGADLRGAHLSGADLFDARLYGADLRRADLDRADLRRAWLDRVNFSEASVWLTIFADVNLSTAEGLETVRHQGPSTIGIDTLYRSCGNIPEAFLRGAGVPDEMITYSKSLVGRPFEFYSCFISYSSKDQEFAERLHANMQDKGVRCWFAPEDIQGGRKLHEQIDEAIRIHQRLLLILSPHSMTSEWVKTEIAKARQRELQESRRVLFPIRLVQLGASSIPV
jgi:uncharacterized protein YjbI with pentapeptide repeats